MRQLFEKMADMGVHNRERRRHKVAKRARQRHEDQGRATRGERWSSSSFEWTASLLLDAAVEALHHGSDDAVDLVDMLADGPPIAGGRRMVVQCIADALQSELGELRSQDWRPREVQRVVRRGLGNPGAVLVARAMRDECRREVIADLEWVEEVSSLEEVDAKLDPDALTWRDDVSVAVAVIGILCHLPRLPSRTSHGRGARRESGPSDRDQQILERVRALLAKAESTSFPEEADALTAKAQELLSRHSIDRAALENGAERRSAPSIRRVWIDDPYVGSKGRLLHVVALANRCRSVLLKDLDLAVVAGNDDDLDTVELLFTSLMLQATTQMTAAGAGDRGSGGSRTRSFRQSFLIGFGTRIGQRLLAANERSVSSATEVHGSSLLPVLAFRRSAADAAVEEMFPELQPLRLSANDRQGWAAGAAAADLATLVVQPEITGFAEAAAG